MGVILLATGDLMLRHPPAGADGGAAGAQDAAAAQNAAAAALGLLPAADLTFVNLETPLCRGGYPADKWVNFRSPPELAATLACLGIHVATVANNHALDFGPEGLLETLDALRAADVTPVGGGADLTAALAPAVLERQGLKIACFGLACTLPPGFAASRTRPGIAPIKVYSKFILDPTLLDEQPGTAPYVETLALAADVEQACAAIRQARAACDVVVVGLHWGVAHGWVAVHQDYLADYQVPLGHALIDAGADVIIGHHAHVVHGVEIYRGRPIFYSLGNFMFHALAGGGGSLDLSRFYPPYQVANLLGAITEESFVVRIELAGGGAGGSAAAAGHPSPVRGIEIIPTVMNPAGEPVLPPAPRAAAILDRVAVLSRRFGTRLTVDGGRARIAIATDN